MTQSDPWATAAAVQSASTGAPTGDAGQQSTTPATTGGVTANPVSDMSNPFATAAEVTPAFGAFDPFVPNDALLGRPLILVPKFFTDKDPKPEKFGGKPGEVRDRWTVDIVILGGTPLEFDYQGKDEKDGPLVDKHYGPESTFPITFRGQRIYSGQLIAALNGANKEGKFVFGVFVRAPKREDERKGVTWRTIEERFAKWREQIIAGKDTPKPAHTYNLTADSDVWTADHVNAAMAWWEQEKKSRLATAS